MYKYTKQTGSGEENVLSPTHSSVRRLQTENSDIILQAQGFKASNVMFRHKNAQLQKRPILEPLVRKQRAGSSILSAMAYPSTFLTKPGGNSTKISSHIQMDKIYRLKSFEREVFERSLEGAETKHHRGGKSSDKAGFRSIASQQNRRNSPFPDEVSFSHSYCEMPRAFSPYFGSDIVAGSRKSAHLGGKKLRRNGKGGSSNDESFDKSLRRSLDIENPLKPIENRNNMYTPEKIIMYKMPMNKSHDISKAKQAAKEGHITAQLKLLRYKLSLNTAKS